MRKLGLTCTAFIICSLPLAAQGPAPAAQPTPERLDQLLRAWEQRMISVDTLSTKCKRTDVHPLTKKQAIFMGDAAFQKPGMAKIDLTHQDEIGKKDTEKTNFERMYCNDKYIAEYSPRDKLIILHDVPKNDPTADNMILAFLRGMKAEDAKKRFAITLSKETEWYAYLYIQPKSDSDKAEFAAAQLTIWLKNPNQQGQPNLQMMPARLWYRQPNGKEVIYEFTDLQPNVRFEKDAFEARQIPGYTVKRAADAAPAPKPMTPKTSRP
jgi:TIGR03009 family protein